MRAIVTILVIIAIIWTLNACTGAFIESSSQKLSTNIAQTRAAVETGDMQAYKNGIVALRSEWESDESRWEALVDHREVDRIDTLMTHLEALANGGNPEDILPELDELSFFLAHIGDKIKIRLENIL